MRIACLLVPDLPLHAELRASPELVGRPLVITSGPGPRAEIVSASREADARGIRIGRTPSQARAICPDLQIRIASPVLERTARETLLDIALSLSPRAELAPRARGPFVSEAAVFVDASGIRSLHHSERRFASMLQARAEHAGLGGVVALASTRETARLAARHLAHLPTRRDRSEDSETIRILSPETELAFLDPLPVDLLDPDDRTAQALTRFGIRRIRDLLRLPRRDLAARLGSEILELVARARGEASESPIAEPRSRRLEEGIDLETPVEQLEPMAFVLRGLVSRLVERLALRSLGCAELQLTLHLEGGRRARRRESRRIGLTSATRDERVLLRLLRLDLESHPPGAAVEGVTLSSEGVPIARDQLDLFLPRGPSASELDQTLAELASLCGSERVGAPAVVDSHRPDAFALEPFRPDRARPDPPSSDREPPRNVGPTLRALRPPLRAEVRVERGKPAFVRSAVGRGEVRAVSGPWRTTGSWWSESAHFAMDRYDVQMSDGTVLRLCYDWKTKWWQIDGLYD